MAIKVEKQSPKFIKPFVPTPTTLRQYKLGFIDELVGAIYVGVVLFFSANDNHNPNFVARLEKSLEKTLTRFYPLAGRYVEKTQTIDCNDEGAEFIYANANIKLEDFLVSERNVKFIDDFIPSKIGAIHEHSDSLLATQVTTFKCGGVALGVSCTHKIVDASTLCTIINEWATLNREEHETNFKGPGFNSSVLFPPRGVTSIPVQHMDDDMLSKYTRKKLSFKESLISNMKAKGDNGTRRWSKVQIISSIIWKTFIDVDRTICNDQRESILIQAIDLREKMGSLIPKNSCGNLWRICVTECKALETIEELLDRLTDSVKKSITELSMGNHNSEDGQQMVLNSFPNMSTISVSTSLNAVLTSSWCKFPWYEADFGFGKPVWAAPGTIPGNHTAYLIDDAEGNGVEAYVFLEVKDVPYFDEALDHVLMHYGP